MGELLLKKYGEEPAASTSDAPRVPFHINFELKEGDQRAMAYGQLVWLNFNLSSGIQLHFGSHTVTIKGRCLQGLYDKLLRHEVAHLRVESERHNVGELDQPVVTNIHVKQVQTVLPNSGMAFDPDPDQ